MSFGLGRGRVLEPGAVGITAEELGPLPDNPAADTDAARVDPRGWFADASRPLEIEIGSGKGTFLIQHGEEEPGTNLLGIEWAGEFYAYAADRVRRRSMGNVRLLHGDAAEFLRWRCPDGVARVIHLYFSDPWPKTRHHKRRVVQDRFLADARRVLEPGGEVRIVTDHEGYWAWMESHFARWCEGEGDGATERQSDERCARGNAGAAPDGGARFERLEFERSAAAGDGELVGTNFERKYRREGRPFHAVILRKRP